MKTRTFDGKDGQYSNTCRKCGCHFWSDKRDHWPCGDCSPDLGWAVTTELIQAKIIKHFETSDLTTKPTEQGAE